MIEPSPSEFITIGRILAPQGLAVEAKVYFVSRSTAEYQNHPFTGVGLAREIEYFKAVGEDRAADQSCRQNQAAESIMYRLQGGGRLRSGSEKTSEYCVVHEP